MNNRTAIAGVVPDSLVVVIGKIEMQKDRARHRLTSVLLAVALVGACSLSFSAAAQASSGVISRAYANSTWTQGSFAGSVTWSECQSGFSCKWIPYATVQPSLPSYNCTGEEWLEYSDHNISQVWSGGGQSANGTVSFDLPKSSILQGVQGQRLCVSVIYGYWRRNPVCVAQAPIFGQDPNVVCPYEEAIFSKWITTKLLEVEPPPTPAPTLPSTSTPVPTQIVVKCKKGFKKKTVKGKVKCIPRHKHKQHQHSRRG